MFIVPSCWLNCLGLVFNELGGDMVYLDWFGELENFFRWLLYIEGEGVSKLRCMVMRIGWRCS